MIDFSDNTIRDGHGYYKLIKRIMENEGPSTWMLKSRATVHSSSIDCDYLLHFWHDGKTIIHMTNHPVGPEAPDDDIQELSKWCKDHGWTLHIHSDLLEERKDFDFWIKFYYSGMIFNEIFCKYEKDEIERMKKAYKTEEIENVD